MISFLLLANDSSSHYSWSQLNYHKYLKRKSLVIKPAKFACVWCSTSNNGGPNDGQCPCSGFHEHFKMDLLDKQWYYLFVVWIKLRYGWIIIKSQFNKSIVTDDFDDNQSHSTPFIIILFSQTKCSIIRDYF